MLYQIILASIIGGILSLGGGIFLLWKRELANKLSFYLISFAAGSLLGAAFFDLIPEALEGGGVAVVPFILLGILIVFIFESSLGWYHHHDQHLHDEHTFTVHTVLFGDALHNFIDGIAIAIGFAVSVEVGITTTFAVFVHEIPQEIGDFGILIQRGYSRAKIIFYNFLTALATLVGAVFAYFLFPFASEMFIFYALAVAAGTFIYISTSDLIPELRKYATGNLGVRHAIIIFIGIFVVAIMSDIIPG